MKGVTLDTVKRSQEALDSKRMGWGPGQSECEGFCNNPGVKPVGACTGLAASGWETLLEAEGLRGSDSS